MQQDDSNSASAEYANFGVRLVAFLLDRIFLSVACFGLAWLAAMVIATDAGGVIAFTFGLGFLFTIILGPIYFSVLESSAQQATLGKRIVGIKVVDLNGNRLSFMHALGRTMSAIITALVPLMIGYFMAAFTQRKQAIHDMIASTLVVTAQSVPGAVPTNEAKGGNSAAVVAVVVIAVVLFFFAVIGILAAIAIPQYHDYTMRAKLANVVMTVKSITPKVDQYFIDNQRLPADIQALGVTLSDAESKYVKSIQIDQRTGQVTAQITGVANAEGMRLLFTPSEVGAPNAVWKCHSEDISPRLLPTACRQRVTTER
jgi:uncharacterized RDD family membrane protein YckC/Tfp pilus assembly protein PilE